MNYYNEFDPFAAAWLRNLIAAGEIPAGDVDDRSILDVRPSDLRGYTQCHFFAGIGGWPLALRLAGWPERRPVWTGSPPCQPFSDAGKKKGFGDDRHLWPVYFELIRQCRPPVVFGEQVASKDALAWLDHVHADMEGENYAIGTFDLSAAGIGSPHRRQRLFIVADTDRPAGERDAGGLSGEEAEGRGARIVDGHLPVGHRGGDATRLVADTELPRTARFGSLGGQTSGEAQLRSGASGRRGNGGVGLSPGAGSQGGAILWPPRPGIKGSTSERADSEGAGKTSPCVCQPTRKWTRPNYRTRRHMRPR